MEICGRTLIACLAAAWTSTASADPRYDRYDGACDASAAIGLAADRFVMAEDEHDVLLVYRFGGGSPVAEIDVTDFLGNRRPGHKPKEADLEGAAMIGRTIYWISSHGRDRHGDYEPTRHRVFATEMVPGASPTIKPVGNVYKELIKDISAAPQTRSLDLAGASTKAPEAEGGLNIEGLAASPEGHLLIGFRNPLPAGKALVVKLTNPAGVVERGEKPDFEAPLLLDLGGRGIRSMELVGSRYVIIAGPFGDSPGGTSDFALFSWGGDDQAPVRLTADFGSLRPEALFATDIADEVYVLSDDGDEPIDGQPCKSSKVPMAKKYFRGMRLRIR
jgi:hypothetical protein